ncbi:hypothetical protein PP175_27345 (plasmid) [Aneurinibacillus sp. Ricciae_BoGa-3]|uniref:hypothetical protein n=1 Tax=Aneurinibacillus sp. Ricciae_BoGa-3 TaxID=3022697 RepID=UPI002341B8BB|nr:hypothetical protein [Aneurinibacillus sp. Ricciae_BoGa-3]WCK56931.1 hypothetical protein PP175_27460 [Aneurinibacillus sp. Ricciae_BoGa-3]WCK57754.1 hypothetical protein PP175_27345 [Aneurinibacillus sp. Ricciae_BoGa-3]
MKKIKQSLTDKKGAISIFYVVGVLICALIVTASVDILKQIWILNEVQSVMDTAGVSALHQGVDTHKLRAEEFVFDESAIVSSYENLVYSSIPVGSNITTRGLINTYVEYGGANDNWGLGVSTHGGNQLLLRSEMILRVKTDKLFDTLPGIQKVFYDSRSNSDFTVSFNGTPKDGETELIVRSVSRIVYR